MLHVEKIITIVLATLLFSCTVEKEQPNIIFILADDLCYNTIHELGNDEVITPTLDELAQQGTVFTTAYNMGGWHGAICVASRTMFNTGRFLWNAHELDRKLDSLAGNGELWSLEMEALGYNTYMSGKWHVKIKPEIIFNYTGTKRPGMPGATPEGYHRPRDMDDHAWTPWDKKFGGYWEGGKHWSEVLADESISFLQTASESDKPFFMYIAFNAPHDPRQSPREFVDMYPLDKVSVPESFLPEYPYKDDIGCGSKLRDEKLAPFPRTEYSVKVNRQEYYAIITHMDEQIGRIIQKLKENGQANNTYIFFTADHGLSVGNHGLIGKQNMYEHSMRAPLIVIGPDIPIGKRNHREVYIQDIMPTAIEYAGGQIPEYVEFHSLKSLIEDPGKNSFYPEVYGAYMDLQRFIRMDDYKLIVYPYAGVKRLFNLASDPGELTDLAGNPSYSERIDHMFQALEKEMEVMNDTLVLGHLSFDYFVF